MAVVLGLIFTPDCFLRSLNLQCSFHGGGSLAVPGADEDAKRIVALIQDVTFDAIYVTLDTHQKVNKKNCLITVNREGGDVRENPLKFIVRL